MSKEQRIWNFKTATTDVISDLIKHYIESGQLTIEVHEPDGKISDYFEESTETKMELEYHEDGFNIIARRIK